MRKIEKVERAYSVLEIKAIDEDQRVITGWATTPEPDRMDDVVDPEGAEFKLPLPLLWQHDSRKPIGQVIRARVSKDGIEIVAKIAKGVTDEIDEAWKLIKSGLVRGLSIGFQSIKVKPIKDSFGVMFQEWEWLELSAVTIPANQEATITAIKSYDSRSEAASGREARGERRTGVSVRNTMEKKMKKKSIAEQISAAMDKRKVLAEQMTDIAAAADEKGETLDAAQQQEFDGLADQLKSIDEHVARLKVLESISVEKAAPVTQPGDQEDASAMRASRPSVHFLKQDLPKGTAFTRMVSALVATKGNRGDAAVWAQQWRDSTPEVERVLRMPFDVIEKAAVDPGTTTHATWAEPLVQYNIMASEFIEFLRPLTVIGRITNFRRVPFKIKVPRQTGGASVNWVGETRVKPLSSLAFDSVLLEHYKIAGIIPMSEELVRFSNPSAEALVRTDLAAAVSQFMDTEFLDPAKAEAVGVSPASITNSATPVVASGTTAAAFRTDVRALFQKFFDANIPVVDGTWIMRQGRALALSLMQNSLGQAEFPGITPQGGTLLGYPVVVSQNTPAQGGSPTDGDLIIFALAPEIMLADDGAVSIDMSREASLQMDSTPDSPLTASTVMVNLWQHNLVALKAERFINWKLRRAQAVQYIASAKYAE